MPVAVTPILDTDLDEVARFLHDEMNAAVPVDSWVRSLRANRVAAPNHGFALRDGGRVVGAYTAHYSERDLGRGPERFCNLSAWCVLPEYRLHGVRLLKTLLAQPGYHFLDLSPSGAVVTLNERLGFRHLDTTTALVPILPWPWRPSSVVTDRAGIEAALSGPELALYRDHHDREAARHLVLRRGERHCWVVYRMDRRRGLPRVFASVLHVGDQELFHALLRPFCGSLLARHGALALLAELRVVGARPRGSTPVRRPRPKMIHSATLAERDVDYFYSELVSLSW